MLISKAMRFDVFEKDYSELDKARQYDVNELLLDIADINIELEDVTEKSARNSLIRARQTMESELYDIYYKQAYTVEDALKALQAIDFHEELLPEMLKSGAFKESTLKGAYSAYIDSDWMFQKKYSFFRFLHFWACVPPVYDIEGSRVNENGNDYDGPYNMQYPSELLKQWDLGPSRKNSDTMFTTEALKRYSKNVLLKTHAFQTASGITLQ